MYELFRVWLSWWYYCNCMSKCARAITSTNATRFLRCVCLCFLYHCLFTRCVCVLVSVRRVLHVQNHCTYCIRQLNSCLNVSVNIVLYPCGYAICMPARKPLLLLLRLARHRRKIANRDSNVMNNSRIKNKMYTCMPNPIWNETAATQSKIKKNRANPMLWQTHAQSFGSET